jgi:DNA-binding GntR family transcriptional regulator
MTVGGPRELVLISTMKADVPLAQLRSAGERHGAPHPEMSHCEHDGKVVNRKSIFARANSHGSFGADLSEAKMVEIQLTSQGPRTLAAAIYRQLRHDILTARLLPGARLQIAPLAARFDVSLAGVREALSRLVADGFVQAVDQRGFRVSPVSLDDLRDVTQTRIDIECLALSHSIERGGQAWEDEIRASLNAMLLVPYTDPSQPLGYNEAYVPLHDRYHAALIGACGSVWLWMRTMRSFSIPQ